MRSNLTEEVLNKMKETNLIYNNINFIDEMTGLISSLKNKKPQKKEYVYVPEKIYSFDEIKLDLINKGPLFLKVKENSFELKFVSKFSNIKYVETVDDKLGGYFFKNGSIVISIGVPSLSHELSHILHINNYNRLLLPDFGYKLPSSFNELSSKFFMKVVSVETRVRAIQSVIEGLSNEKAVRSLDSWLFLNIEEQGKFPLYKFESYNELKTYLYKIFINERARWNLTLIEEQLNKKFNFIFSFLKTNTNYTKVYSDLYEPSVSDY